MFIKIEGIKHSLLVIALLSHHSGLSLPPVLQNKTLKTQHRSVVFQQNRPFSDVRATTMRPFKIQKQTSKVLARRLCIAPH
jgi:hypothetical protein